MQSIFATKEVTVRGVTVKIGELSVDQIEDLIINRKEVTAVEQDENKTTIEIQKPKTAAAQRTVFGPVVVASLRNTQDGNADWYEAGSREVYTADGEFSEKAFGRAGTGTLIDLYYEILAFCGLDVQKPEKGARAQQGEA